MALQAGSTLGHYEVLAPLGVGGMGEVYRAKDLKLGREVAIKVLPEGFSKERERMSRFEREAKVLAGLNHPNIATLYSFEADGGTRFLVMEVVEGETLEKRLEKGALPIAQVLEIGRQIGDAIDAAHKAGVVHRGSDPQILDTHDLWSVGFNRAAIRGSSLGLRRRSDATKWRPILGQAEVPDRP